MKKILKYFFCIRSDENLLKWKYKYYLPEKPYVQNDFILVKKKTLCR